MPNHVTNIVKVTGAIKRLEEFAAFVGSVGLPEKDFHGNETGETFDRPFDFNNLIPMPPEVEQSIGDPGLPLWYVWSCDNWGTKWNAYDQKVENTNDSLCYTFNTAWSTPDPIWNKLFDLFPDLRFHIEYADEDIGSNCGVIQWDGESPLITDMQGNAEFACRVVGWDYNEYLECMAEDA